MRYGDFLVNIKTNVVGQVREVCDRDVRVMVTHGDGISTDELRWPKTAVRDATHQERVTERTRINDAARISQRNLEEGARIKLGKLDLGDVVAVCDGYITKHGRFPGKSQLEEGLAQRAEVKRNHMPTTRNPLPKLIELAVKEGVLDKLKGSELRTAFHRGHAPRPRLSGQEGHWHYVASGTLDQIIKNAAGEEGTRLDRVLHAEQQLDAAGKLAGWQPTHTTVMGHVDKDGLTVSMPTSVLDELLKRASAHSVTPPV